MTTYKIVWPERPVEKHGGLYPHVIAYDNHWNEPVEVLTGYLHTVCMPGVINWHTIRNLETSVSFGKLQAYASPTSLDPLVRFMISKTLEITVEPREGIPAWQCLRVAYHACPIRFSEDKPRMVCSFPYFVKKYYKVETNDDLLREVYATVTGDLSLKFKDFTFHLKKGSDEDAPEVFIHVYTNPADGYSGINPSVNGSCMRKSSWSTQWGTIGISGDLPHPVTAYAVEPLALAWLENSEGETVARTLVNTRDKQLHRIYRWAPDNCDQPSKYAFELEDYFRGILNKHGFNSGNEVLEGVKLRINSIPGTDLCVAPYLDGEYYCVNTYDHSVGKRGYLWRHHNPPVQQCSGEIIECADCGEQLLPHEAEEHDGNYYCADHIPENINVIVCCHCGERCLREDSYVLRGGEWVCESCYQECYFTCAACGDIHHQDDEHIGDDESYCESCFNARFVVCTHCGDAVRKGDRYFTPDEDYCCESCFDERYACCEGCGKTFDHDDLTNGCCPNCQPKELEATHDES